MAGAAEFAAELLDDVEVRRLAEQNLAYLGAGALAKEDQPLVSDIVASTFHDVSVRLRSVPPADEGMTRSGAVAADARTVPKSAVLVAMGLLGDVEVQRIGLEVAHALARNGDADEQQDKSVLLGRLEANLVQRAGELRQIRDRLVPATLRHLATAAAAQGLRPWRATLSPANLRAMRRSAGGHWSTDFGAFAQLDLAEKSAGILGGALEEASAILAVVDLCSGSRLSGDFYPQSAAVVGDLISELSCQATPGSFLDQNLTKAMVCPQRFGLQGLETLLAVPRLEMSG